MLTDTAIRAAKPAQKAQKLFDEKGLFLLVTPSGGRLWRFKYRFPRSGPLRKEKALALGSYPEVSLKQARERRDEARRKIADSVDPGAKRQSDATASSTFKAVALEFLSILRKSSLAGEEPPAAASDAIEPTSQAVQKRRKRLREPISAKTIDTMERRLNRLVFPYIGQREIGAITSPQLLEVLRRIEARGIFETAHRVRSICGRVLRYGKATGRGCTDVAAELIGLLVPVEPEHMAAIVDPVRAGDLLRSIEGYRGETVTRLALKLAPYVFPRPIEFRTMEWVHVNLDSPAPEWRIPWKRMKMRHPHIVPLSQQAVAVLREIRVHTGSGRFVFPQLRKPHKPMSENCITAALRAMGYSGEEMTWHGFRALASTLLNELGWNESWIEVQLAHADQNKVRKAYNHAKYLSQRRAMMQAWADYLDALRANTDIAAINNAGHQASMAAMRAFHQPQSHEHPWVGRQAMEATPSQEERASTCVAERIAQP